MDMDTFGLGRTNVNIYISAVFTSESPDAGVDCAAELSVAALSKLPSHP